MNPNILSRSSLALLFLVASSGALAMETASRTLTIESLLKGGTSLRVDNLLGIVEVRGTAEAGTVRIEARAVAEAKTAEQAQALVDSIRLEHKAGQNEVRVHVAYPLDRATSFRMPKAGMQGLFSRWSAVVAGRATEADYDGRTVQVVKDRKATGLAVHLTITLPYDKSAHIRQIAGAIHGRALRGSLQFETVDADVSATRIFGSLGVDTVRGDVEVESFQGRSLEIRTVAGNVDLLDVKADKTRFQTDSGAIRGNRVAAGAFLVQAGSGNVKLTGVESETTEITSDSGKIDLSTQLRRAREAVFRSASGDVTLRVGKLAHFDLLAETKSGEVKQLGVDLDVVDQSGKTVRLRQGKGGVDLQVTAPGGRCTVRPYEGSRLDILVSK